MNKPLDSLDWSLVQAFLAVAEGGSLSEAARRMGASQPTLGRQIRQIEDLLGVALFTRRPRGLDLTDTGAEMLPHAQAMRAAMRGLSLVAAGHQQALDGPVRVTASHVVAHYILPGILAGLRRDAPGITIDLVPSDTTENLLFREADIAIRMYRPTQLQIVTRHLGDLAICAFASDAYLARRGMPQSPGDLARHDLVGYDRSEMILRAMHEAGWPAERDWFTTRCDSQVTYLELVRAGCGIGFGQRHWIEADPTLSVIDLGVDIPPLPVWLAAAEAMRAAPRVRRVWQALAEGMAPYLI